MKLREAIKSYFSRYDEDDDSAKKKKKKKKKPVKAGSYFKKARGDYEQALKDASDY